ncbi:MAG TPA: ATP-dependent DNA ligase, partial [Pirellula sp.]|nr:ATP-dependent DNA ligase [Pirellula sp.]
RGEELMESRWPEIESSAQRVPDGTVLDGEILGCDAEGNILPFALLQKRINRKSVTKKLIAEVPVVFHCFDILEEGGIDIRSLPWSVRRARLEEMHHSLNAPAIRCTGLLPAESWSDWRTIRESSRERNAEGLMLKRRDAAYESGRMRGTWWKWKVVPFTIDAVLIYAQQGHGKRASLFTDYTFAVWDNGTLVPFAKAYSGLNDSEIREVDGFVRKNTKEAFGPVRSVTPQLVMELAFEGIQKSNRHKCGVATRFPRIVRWRHDKKPEDANSLADLFSLMPDSNGLNQ